MNGLHAHTWFSRSTNTDPNDPFTLYVSSCSRDNTVICVKCLQTFTIGQPIQGCLIPNPSPHPNNASIATPTHVKSAVMSRHFNQGNSSRTPIVESDQSASNSAYSTPTGTINRFGAGLVLSASSTSRGNSNAIENVLSSSLSFAAGVGTGGMKRGSQPGKKGISRQEKVPKHLTDEDRILNFVSEGGHKIVGVLLLHSSCFGSRMPFYDSTFMTNCEEMGLLLNTTAGITDQCNVNGTLGVILGGQDPLPHVGWTLPFGVVTFGDKKKVDRYNSESLVDLSCNNVLLDVMAKNTRLSVKDALSTFCVRKGNCSDWRMCFIANVENIFELPEKKKKNTKCIDLSGVESPVALPHQQSQNLEHVIDSPVEIVLSSASASCNSAPSFTVFDVDAEEQNMPDNVWDSSWEHFYNDDNDYDMMVPESVDEHISHSDQIVETANLSTSSLANPVRERWSTMYLSSSSSSNANATLLNGTPFERDIPLQAQELGLVAEDSSYASNGNLHVVTSAGRGFLEMHNPSSEYQQNLRRDYAQTRYKVVSVIVQTPWPRFMINLWNERGEDPLLLCRRKDDFMLRDNTPAVDIGGPSTQYNAMMTRHINERSSGTGETVLTGIKKLFFTESAQFLSLTSMPQQMKALGTLQVWQLVNEITWNFPLPVISLLFRIISLLDHQTNVDQIENLEWQSIIITVDDFVEWNRMENADSKIFDALKGIGAHVLDSDETEVSLNSMIKTYCAQTDDSIDALLTDYIVAAEATSRPSLTSYVPEKYTVSERCAMKRKLFLRLHFFSPAQIFLMKPYLSGFLHTDIGRNIKEPWFNLVQGTQIIDIDTFMKAIIINRTLDRADRRREACRNALRAAMTAFADPNSYGPVFVSQFLYYWTGSFSFPADVDFEPFLQIIYTEDIHIIESKTCVKGIILSYKRYCNVDAFGEPLEHNSVPEENVGVVKYGLHLLMEDIENFLIKGNFLGTESTYSHG